MARIPMVTRTIKVTKALVMCYEPLTNETSDREFFVTGSFKNDQKLFSRLKELYETETLKLVYLKISGTQNELYGMPEEAFMQNAEKLPTRKKKEDNDTSSPDEA